MTEPPIGEDHESPAGRTNWTTITLVGALILLMLVIAYFATRRNGDEDKLTNTEVASSRAANPEKLCASSNTYGLIKQDLFRRAAQLRGSDQAAYDRLASYAVVRMENPVMESKDSATGAVNCSGSLSLDLPPGVAVVGGRRTLTSDIDYTVTPAADGSGMVVLLRNADAIVTPLATLGGIGERAPVASQSITNETRSETPSAPFPPAQAPVGNPPPSVRPGRIGPSFDCGAARTRGEVAICGDQGLAALDRQMANQYNRALSGASPDQRGLLRDTARRFYAYRDECSSNACIAEAYTERMREIRDIIEGRWEEPR